MGFRNRGGARDVPGMLFANRSAWGDIVEACGDLLSRQPDELLDPAEIAANCGRGDPLALS